MSRKDGREAYHAQWYSRNRETIRAKAKAKYQALRQAWFAANGPCVDCGSWESLEVDHVDPKTKIHHNVWKWSAVRRDAELKKCVPRCTACHRKKTYTIDYPKAEHGIYAYTFKGCRCEVCRAANAGVARRHIAKARALKAWTEPGRKHGEWLYNLGCRCEVCVTTKRAGQLRRDLARASRGAA